MANVRKPLKTKAATTATVKERKPRSFDGFKSDGAILVAAILALGAKYNPPNTNITEVNIRLKQTELGDIMQALLEAIFPEKAALIARNNGFEFMFSSTTTSLRAFKSSNGVLPAQIKIATNLAKKVFSIRIIAIKNTPAPVIDPIDLTINENELDVLRRNSVSQQQFMSRAGNYITYMTYICSHAFYNPALPHLKPAFLKAYSETLSPLNDTAEEAIKLTDYTRSARNESFFNNTTGARYLYNQVKDEFASFGAKSAENKLVKGLAFYNLLPVKSRTPTTNFKIN